MFCQVKQSHRQDDRKVRLAKEGPGTKPRGRSAEPRRVAGFRTSARARRHRGALRHDAGPLPGDLVEHTARAPQVHFVGVEAIGEETLWGAVPAGGNVLCVRLLGIDAPAGPKVP